MGIEVREIVIRASVGKEDNASAPAAKAQGSEGPAEQIIRMCVEKVLEIIKEKNGR
jgi:hypothetical protein